MLVKWVARRIIVVFNHLAKTKIQRTSCRKKKKCQISQPREFLCYGKQFFFVNASRKCEVSGRVNRSVESENVKHPE